MSTCPACLKPLRTARQDQGLFFICDECGGKAVTIPQLDRVIGNAFVTELLQQIGRAAGVSQRKCPFCGGLMKQFETPREGLVLDACKPCGAVWFDPLEFEQAAERATDRRTQPGRFDAASGKHSADRASVEDGVAAEALRALAVLVGFPF